MKILNLYCGIGGNRKMWGNEHEVTAVENVPEIAKIYQDFFPKDKVIIADAHQYLLDHYKEFDFIWSSPPCPTHSGTNNFLNAQGVVRYPDMALWQEIIFLNHFCKKKWVVENVISYYEPFIRPQQSGRHYFWANFLIPFKEIECKFNIANMRATTRKEPEENLRSLELFHGIKLPDKTKNARMLLRNCVKPELGKHIFDFAFKNKQLTLLDKNLSGGGKDV